MSGFRAVETSLGILEAAASVGLIVRFLHDGLNQVYRFFFIYLIVFTAQQIGPWVIPRHSDFYAWFFFITESITVCLYALITLELYSLALREFSGLATVARRYVRIALALAILFSVIQLIWEPPPDSIVSRFFSFEKPIVSSLFCFVVLITGFLYYYPLPVSRNVIIYTIGYAVYFFTKTVALFLRRGHDWDRILSLSMLAASTVCIVFWVVSLNRAGEQKARGTGLKWAREDEQRVLRELESLSASLLRARK